MAAVLYLCFSLVDRCAFTIWREGSIYLVVELFACLFSTVLTAIKHFSNAVLPIYTPTSNEQEFSLLTYGVLCSFQFRFFSWCAVFLYFFCPMPWATHPFVPEFCCLWNGDDKSSLFLRNTCNDTCQVFDALTGTEYSITDGTCHSSWPSSPWLTTPRHRCQERLLSIRQRESSFLDKTTNLCQGSKAEKSPLCWKNSEKSPLSLHGCLVGARDRNVWLATHSIVLFQKEGD